MKVYTVQINEAQRHFLLRGLVEVMTSYKGLSLQETEEHKALILGLSQIVESTDTQIVHGLCL